MRSSTSAPVTRQEMESGAPKMLDVWVLTLFRSTQNDTVKSSSPRSGTHPVSRKLLALVLPAPCREVPN